jgi:hypothetical protein
MSDFKKTNKIIAFAMLVIGLLTYGSTVAPTVSYWDCGEFIAAAATFGIPHPAGAPLFVIIGRVASYFAGSPENVAYAINMLSVFSSAFTLMFMYLTLMLIFDRWKGLSENIYDFLTRSISSIIGTLCFAFCHTFWFSAVETEMYAHVMLFVSLVYWLMMKWSFVHEEEGSDKYLLLIAYILGLSLGVHILTILVLPTLTLIYFYVKKEDTVSNGQSVWYLFIGNILVLLIYPGIIKYYPLAIRSLGSMVWGLLILIIMLGIAYYFYTNHKRGAFMFVACLFLVTLGYTSYFSVYVRSGLNPAMDENDPETLTSFISYISRDQYGDGSVFPRKWSVKSPQTGKVWVGDGTGVVHRFPDGSVRKINSVDELGAGSAQFEHLSAQLQFLWNYQYRHMFLRYIGWNFIGTPDGEPQHAGADFSKLFGLPLLFSLFGAGYLYQKNREAFWSTMSIFLMFGFVFYLLVVNPNDPQPRERDYSSVVSFFAMALWIPFGVYGFVEYLNKIVSKSSSLAYAILALLFLGLPMRMLAVNYHSHDRTGNTVAWDYSYNILMSCEENAILFTNGDNDTFPIWYLQIVEGIRPDVTAVNLSLLNTPWYIKQQKNGQLGRPAPIGYSDAQIEQHFKQPIRWAKKQLTINVPTSHMNKEHGEYQNYKEQTFHFTEDENSSISFELPPQMTYSTPQGPIGLLRVQDMVALNMITENNWERPLSWAVTVGGGNLLGGLRDYMRMDGLVYTLTSVKDWPIDPVKLEHLVDSVYLYRSLSNKDVYLNNNVKGLIQNIRSAYIQLSQHYANTGQKEKQKNILELMHKNINPDVVPYGNRNMELLVDLVTKLDKPSELKPELLDSYNNSDLDFIWQQAHHVLKNNKLRNIALESLIDRLLISDQKRMQYIVYIIQTNNNDLALKTSYLEKYSQEYQAINPNFVTQLKSL